MHFWGLRSSVRSLAFAVLGGLGALGQAPSELWPLTIVAFAVCFWVSRDAPRNVSFGTIWFWTGFGYFAIALRWIIEPFLVDLARHGWMAPFSIVLMASGLALFWAAAGVLATRMGRSLVVLVATLSLAEVLRSLILTGFPWALAGHIWIETPLGQLAAFAGPHALTLLSFGLSAALAGLAAGVWIAGVVPLACLVAWAILNPQAPAQLVDRPFVRIVHPNIPQAEKWAPELRARNFTKLLELTKGDQPVDLIVWPESAVTELLENAGPAFEVMTDLAQRAPVITGIQRRASGQIYHNSFAVLGRGGQVQALYDKQHLVPFGEYIPLGELASRLGIYGLAPSEGGGFTPGSGTRVLEVPGIGAVRPLICYEVIFAEEVRATATRPDLMILVTNDAWFGTGAGPFQHLRQAQLRSIELGLPMIRATNSGISAVIDGKGRLVAQIGLGQAGRLDAPIPEALPKTIYARTGDAPAIALILVISVFGWRTDRSKSD